MGALREILARFGFEVDDKKLKDADAKVNSYSDNLKALAGVIGGGFLLGKMRDFVNELRSTASELRLNSQKAGMSVQEWQRWQTAAELAEVSGESLSNGIRFLQKNLAEASEKGGESAKAFKSLGVEFKDSGGHIRNTGDVLKESAVKIADIKNPAERTGAVLKLFGRAGTSLLPFFNKGAKGIDGLLGKLDELGGGLDDDAIEKLSQSTVASKELDIAWLSLKGRLASQLLPGLTSFVKGATQGVLGFLKLAKGSSIFQAAILVLGSVAVSTAIKMYASYLPMIAGFALLVLLVDDLISAFKGGDSVIGRVIDKLFGAGTAKDFFGGIRDSFTDLLDKLDKGGSTFGEKLEVFFLNVGGKIGDFGENIAEAWRLTWVNLNAESQTGGTTMVDFLVSKLKELVTALGKIGLDAANSLADGIIDGILGTADRVIDAIKGMGEAVKAKLKSVWDSHSPSKVGFKEGFNLDMGVVGGIARGTQQVENQADKTFSQAIPDLSYAPSIRGRGAGGFPGQVQMQNRTQIDINVSGAQGSGKGLADQVRDGAKTALNDSNNEMLYDLETLAEAS